MQKSAGQQLSPSCGQLFINIQKSSSEWYKFGTKLVFETEGKSQKPLILPHSYLSVLRIVGIESRINVSFCIIQYYSNFLNFFATYYHALFCIMQAEIVALLLYLQNPVALQHIHQGLFPKKCVNCVISFQLLLFSSYQ